MNGNSMASLDAYDLEHVRLSWLDPVKSNPDIVLPDMALLKFTQSECAG